MIHNLNRAFGAYNNIYAVALCFRDNVKYILFVLKRAEHLSEFLRIRIFGVLKKSVNTGNLKLSAVDLIHHIVYDLDYRCYEFRIGTELGFKLHDDRQSYFRRVKSRNVAVKKCYQPAELTRVYPVFRTDAFGLNRRIRHDHYEYESIAVYYEALKPCDGNAGVSRLHGDTRVICKR